MATNYTIDLSRPVGKAPQIPVAPCPFCGNQKIGFSGGIHLATYEFYQQVVCGRCGAAGPISGIKSALEVWNRRGES